MAPRKRWDPWTTTTRGPTRPCAMAIRRAAIPAKRPRTSRRPITTSVTPRRTRFRREASMVERSVARRLESGRLAADISRDDLAVVVVQKLMRVSRGLLRGGLLRTGDRQARFANGEVVIPGKYQIEGLAIAAHPLGREAGRVTGADIPFLRKVHGRPWPPRLRGVVNGEAPFKAGVGFVALGS